MKASEFLAHVQDRRVVAAIRKAEMITSAEIRILVDHGRVRDARAAACHHFRRTGMHRTRERNALLLFLVPATREFAIVADDAIDRLVGPTAWEALASELSDKFRTGDFTGGLVRCVEHAGELLGQHFPRSPLDTNELPDDIGETDSGP